MDRKTRGIIEETLDYVYEEQDFLETINWILEVDSEVKSPEDLALGYFLGSLMRCADNTIRREKLWRAQKRGMEKRLGKEEAKEYLREVEERTKDIKPLRVSVTRREKNQIRDMLRRRIPSREKIYRELYR